MAVSAPAAEGTELDALGNVVPEGYAYYQKVIAPGDELDLTGARLKWYDLYPPEVPVTPDQRAEARAFLQAEARSGRLKLQGELGFVLLHRAGPYLLLLLTTWRNTNEMWESIYLEEATSAGGYQPLSFETSHRGTYCVWELGAVWHERNAWVRFLSSGRDAAAKRAYLEDRFSGRV